MSSIVTRRRLMARAAALSAVSIAAPILAPLPAFAARDPFWRLDATAQADLVRRGEVSARELVDAAIARIESLNPVLNAVVTPLFERARAAAEGPLPKGPFSGVPFLVKDLNDLEGVRTSGGSRLTAGHVADRTEPFVQRALEAGLVPLGKSNTPEYGLLGTTESLALGACRNPWDTGRTPGGSSGGAGAAVAAGMVSVAHATDGGGSIRIPASCCGLFGLKPSRARQWAGEAGDPLSVQLCVSRSVRDSATFFAALEGGGSGSSLPPVGRVTDPADRRLRIAFTSVGHTGAAPHPDVEAAVQRAAALCEELGHTVEEAAPAVDGDSFVHHFMTVWGAGAAGIVAEAERRKLVPDSVLEPWTLGLTEMFRQRETSAMDEALTHFQQMARIYEAFFSRYDVVLTPTLAAPPVQIGDQAPTVAFDELFQRVVGWVAYTPIHNAAGTPAMSVPLGWSADGLPIGVQFAAATGAERTLFELAYELEAAAPWADRWPAMAT